MMTDMDPREQIARLRVAELIADIGSNRLTPGAGSAGAVALALAAACATKAVAVSLKHHPAEESLLRARATFEAVARTALIDADADAAAFAAFVHSQTRGAADRLVREGESVGRSIAELLAAVDAVEPFIAANMTGDLLAARALARAASAIQRSNENEIGRAQRT